MIKANATRGIIEFKFYKPAGQETEQNL